MTELETLARLFEQFPGIGPRQAKRFVYFLLRAESSYRESLTSGILSLSKGIARCTLCYRYIPKTGDQCSICTDKSRDQDILMIVLKDADIESFEHMGSYKGLYLVLGTLIPLTEHHTSTKMRTLIESRIKKMPSGSASSECILALPVTTDGEHTRELITETLKVISETHPLTITTLGRGLSTGSELEYADSETLASALKSRA